MAKVKIKRRDGTPTRYFWRDEEEDAPTDKTVYKTSPDGVKRMKTMRFNPVTNQMRRV
ncbi:MAG: hypothetical protein WEG36_15980 [Gemmatimonadota bacterium]|jgi:hypothetical protein